MLQGPNLLDDSQAKSCGIRQQLIERNRFYLDARLEPEVFPEGKTWHLVPYEAAGKVRLAVVELDQGRATHHDMQIAEQVIDLLQFPAPVVILMYLVDQQVRTSGLDKPGRRIDERVFNKITGVRGTIQDMTVAVLEILADILLHES